MGQNHKHYWIVFFNHIHLELRIVTFNYGQTVTIMVTTTVNATYGHNSHTIIVEYQ